MRSFGDEAMDCPRRPATEQLFDVTHVLLASRQRSGGMAPRRVADARQLPSVLNFKLRP